MEGTSVFKDKIYKEVIKVFLLYLLDNGRIRLLIRLRTKMMDPDPGGPKTYGSYGSGSITLSTLIRNPTKYCISGGQVRLGKRGDLRRGEQAVMEAIVEKVPVLGQDIVHSGAGGEAAQQAVPGRLNNLV